MIFRRRNSLELRLTSAEPDIGLVIWLRLFSTVSKRGTYLEDSFFIDYCPCKNEITVPCDIPMATTISCTFICRSFKIISRTFSMISGNAASTGRPAWSVSRVDVRVDVRAC